MKSNIVYRKNISLMKINNIILVLHNHIILLSLFLIYFFLYMSFKKFFYCSHHKLRQEFVFRTFAYEFICDFIAMSVL